MLLAVLMAGCPEECNEFNQPSRLTCGSELRQVAGDGQEVQAGTVAPVQLEVMAVRTPGDARCSETPLADQRVTWVVAAGGGSVSSVSTTTDVSGVARVRWTLGSTLGVQRLTAQWGEQALNSGSPRVTTFNAVALSAPYHTLRKIAGDAQTGSAQARVTVPPEVELVTVREAGAQLPARQTPMDNILVEWTVLDGGGSIDGAFVGTGLNGRAFRDWTLGPSAGAQTLRARVVLVNPPDPRDTLSVTFTASAVLDPVLSLALTPATDIPLRIGETAAITARTYIRSPLIEAPGRSVAWRSSNDAIASVLTSAGPSPSTITVRANGAGTADITATSEGISATIRVIVTAIPARPSRLAYGVAYQAASETPYAAARAYNSSGGPITITRTDTGVYQVRFAGQRTVQGETETILVSAFGGGNHYCVLRNGWNDAAGTDLVAEVRCYIRHPNNYRFDDAQFSIMLLGSEALPGRFGFAYANQPTASGPYTPPKSYNTGGLNPPPVSITRAGPGDYFVTFPGNAGGPADPEAVHVTAVEGSVPDDQYVRCNVADFTGATAHVRCYYAEGSPHDARFTITLLDRGRFGFRTGFAWTVDQFNEEIETPGVLVLEPRVSYSSPSASGGVRLNRIDDGRYEVIFSGLTAVDPSPVFGVQVVDRDVDDAHHCKVVDWFVEGPNLRVLVNCFHADSEPEDESFYLIVLQ